ncbi:cob(I)yrinic acid a,c-diamide adenosyltransferase [Candidatus Pacearchaeota archaeon]|nr:cob(I)yrinic acid a,c-diamide adenosyltransferase [Candidatus Pacearchaeota archaeon]
MEEKKEIKGPGLVQTFWGNGRGKTTSVLGTALRACGNGFNVHLVQFMKNGASSLEEQIPGEIKALQTFQNFSFKRFGLGDWYVKGKNYEEHKKKVNEAFSYLVSCLEKDYDIIIADEILYAIQLGLLEEKKVIELIKNKPKNKELILTGSHKPFPNIFELSDLVTEIKKIKHPYDKGILARKGIEY